MRSFSK